MNIDNQADKPTVIFLLGPTASGKTALAMALQQQLPIELISVDSAMIYRGMDIGTAKPSPAELAAHPHLLIDILDPDQRYSAADFCRDAKQAIQAVIARGHIPLLVGGTMLYFKALLEGLSPLPAADLALRQQLLQQAQQQGWPALHQRLQDCDAIAAQRIHPNDPQRLIRALEVFLLTGQSLTDLTHSKGDGLPYRVIQFAIAPQGRALLHQRVELRFKQMLAQGFEQEAKALFAQYDLHSDLPSVRCVGYRQMWDYLHGIYGYDEMVFRGICATRQLAKRQMTWLRGWQALHWLQSEQMTQALRQIQQVVDATS